jgi:pimeloyl-ACP methyl ester carboxylesterase
MLQKTRESTDLILKARKLPKRDMAAMLVEAMGVLGYERFSVGGHDRGGRSAYRLALDLPDRVERLAVLDPPAPVRRTPSVRKRSCHRRLSTSMSRFPHNATAPTESLQAVEHLPAFRLPQAHLVEFTA